MYTVYSSVRHAAKPAPDAAKPAPDAIVQCTAQLSGPYYGCCSALWAILWVLQCIVGIFIGHFVSKQCTYKIKERSTKYVEFSRFSRATPFRKVSKKYRVQYCVYLRYRAFRGVLPIKTDVKNVFLDVLLTKANGLPRC